MIGAVGLTAARVLSLALIGALQLAFEWRPLPWPVRAFHFVTLLAVLVRPALGPVLLAAFAPVAMSAAGLLGLPAAGGRLVEQLALGCVAGALLIAGRATSGTRLLGGALLVMACAVVSVVAELPSRFLSLATAAGPGELWEDWLSSNHFAHPPLWEPVFYGTLAAEGAALAWAVERIARDHARIIGWTMATTVVAHVVAGLLNINRLIQAAANSDQFWPRIQELLAAARFSLQYDKNAAGSVYAMVLFVALGYAVTGSAWRRVAGSAVAGTVLVAIVLTGSRMAMAAVALGLAIWLIASAIRRPALWTAVAVVALVGTGAAYQLSTFYGERTVEGAVAGRQLLARTALRMTATSPWFGIGVGSFYERSFEFGGDQMIVLVGSANPRENAHNNFLQLLAEQGIVGLAAWLVLLASGLAPVLASLRRSIPRDRFVALGIVVFLATWLTGHPMLVPEAAMVFWLLFGLLTASTPAPSRQWPTRLLLSAAVLLVASTPFRMQLERDTVDLEHRGVGVSAWQHEPGARYRIAGQTFSLFLPSDDSGVFVPVRRAPEAPEKILVEARLDGQLINAIAIVGTEWGAMRFRLPGSAPRFARVDFTIVAADGTIAPDAPLIHVGRARVLGTSNASPP